MKGLDTIYSILRRFEIVVRKLRGGGYFSINYLDKKLEKYVDFDNGYFVELGANNGVNQSNSLYFELKRNWKGILIEPSPNNFLLCKANRSNENFIYCNACVGFDYSEKYVNIKYANLMSISDNLDLDLINKEKHLESAKEYLKDDESIFEFGAVASTLSNLLDKSNAPNLIDFLSLDVEGAELEVLKGIDFKKYKFRYLLIEIRDSDRIMKFLKSVGYEFVERFSDHDYLFSNSEFRKK